MSIITSTWLKSSYRGKDCDLSVTDLTRPIYQLWHKVNTNEEDINTSDSTSFKSYLGSALHKAIECVDEDGVVKEFSWVKTMEDGTRIGGTADELRWRYSINKWRLGDIKLKGTYPAKKFIEGEQDKERLQLSIYRWLFDGMFDIDDKAVIYLFVAGHTKRERFDEVSEQWLELLPIKAVDDMIKGKLAIIRSKTPPTIDCPDWLCPFCEFKSVCTKYKEKPTGFTDES